MSAFTSSSISCITFSLVDATSLAAVTPPTYITFNYPTLTIGPTTAGLISTASVIYSWKIKAVDKSGTITYETLTITIQHECYSATATQSSTTGVVINYIVLSGTQTTTVTAPFTTSGEPTGESCFSYAFYDSSSPRVLLPSTTGYF